MKPRLGKLLIIFSASFAGLLITEILLVTLNLPRHYDRPFHIMLNKLDENITIEKGRTELIEDIDLLWDNLPLGLDVDEHGLKINPYDSSLATITGLFIGDSVTFASDVNIDQTFAAKITELSTGKIRTINAGVEAYSSFQGLKKLQKIIGDIKPYFIVVSFFYNDAQESCFTDAQLQKYVSSSYNKNSLFYKIRILKYLSILAKDIRYLQNRGLLYSQDCEIKTSRVPLPEFISNHLEMARLAQEYHAKIYFLKIPLRKDYIDFEKSYNLYLNTLESALNKYNYPVINIAHLTPNAEHVRDDLILDWCHLTPAGNIFLAKELLGIIQKDFKL